MLTPANVNESVVADALPIGDEAAVYADKAYDSAARRVRGSRSTGVSDGIVRCGHPNLPLTPQRAVDRNRALVPIRSEIERVFGTLQRSYGWTRARCRGLPKRRPRP